MLEFSNNLPKSAERPLRWPSWADPRTLRGLCPGFARHIRGATLLYRSKHATALPLTDRHRSACRTGIFACRQLRACGTWVQQSPLGAPAPVWFPAWALPAGMALGRELSPAQSFPIRRWERTEAISESRRVAGGPNSVSTGSGCEVERRSHIAGHFLRHAERLGTGIPNRFSTNRNCEVGQGFTDKGARSGPSVQRVRDQSAYTSRIPCSWTGNYRFTSASGR